MDGFVEVNTVGLFFLVCVGSSVEPVSDGEEGEDDNDEPAGPLPENSDQLTLDELKVEHGHGNNHDWIVTLVIFNTGCAIMCRELLIATAAASMQI